MKGGRREKVQLATKFGITSISLAEGLAVTGDPTYVKEACAGSLKRLGVEFIDLYYVHRIDTTIPIELTVSPSSFLLKLNPATCQPNPRFMIDNENIRKQDIKSEINSFNIVMLLDGSTEGAS